MATEEKINNAEQIQEEVNVGQNEETLQQTEAEINEQEESPEVKVDPLEAAHIEIAELKKQILYKVAEFDNYRKRTIKEKAELIKNGGERAIESILPVLDDFERALSNMAKDENAAEVMTGVELIYNKFVGILKQNGLQKIETEGAEFNTDFHEAIAIIPTPDENLKGKVLDCVQAGYTLNDKVIRHAKVAVGE